LISFQINLVPPQYLIGKVFKSSRHSIIISAGSYVVVMGLIFTLGILAQVGAYLKDVNNTFGMAQDVGDQQGHPSQGGGPKRFDFVSVSDSRNSPH